MIRVVHITNALLRYAGYADFARKYAPAPSISSLHPIPLSAAALYEILCSNDPYYFDARIDDPRLISSVEHANKNKSTYELHHPYAVRILGEVAPAHQGRGGCPIVSDLDDAKKDKTRKRTGREVIEGRTTTACVGEEGQGFQNRATATGVPRSLPGKKDSGDIVSGLAQGRLSPERPACYPVCTSKIAKTRLNASLLNSTSPPTQPAWTNPCAENKAESIRLDHLTQGVANAESSSGTPRDITLTSNDPSLCTLNTYATTTLSDVTQAIRQYSVTTRNRFELLSVVDDVVGQKPREEQERDLAVLPPTYTKKRVKKLATDTPNAIAIPAAHAEMSSNSIDKALTLDAIDSAQEVRRSARQAYREFEGGM
ncbi:hypothetical protein BGZ47_009740 [Haplosporangium gracile]|nr:hypothetical protein BGZ47_009740 [Haplosporangium gracile]